MHYTLYTGQHVRLMASASTPDGRGDLSELYRANSNNESFGQPWLAETSRKHNRARAEGHLFAGNDQVFNWYFWKGLPWDIQNRTS